MVCSQVQLHSLQWVQLLLSLQPLLVVLQLRSLQLSLLPVLLLLLTIVEVLTIFLSKRRKDDDFILQIVSIYKNPS